MKRYLLFWLWLAVASQALAQSAPRGGATNANVVSPTTYGAKLDALGATDGAITSAGTSVMSALLTSASNTKTCVVRGAGASSGTLIGTLSGCSTGTCTISVAAGTTVTGARIVVGTDDTTAWQTALNACPKGGAVDAGPVYRSIVRQLDVPNGVMLGLPTRGVYDPQTDPTLTSHGPTLLLIEHATIPAITLNFGSGVGDLIFYSISQLSPRAAAPTPYAPFIGMANTPAGCYISKPFLANAYWGLDISGGRHRIDFLKVGGIYRGVTIDHSQDWNDIGTIENQVFYLTCEGLDPSTPSGFDAWALGNLTVLRVNRADSFSVQKLLVFRAAVALLVDDSADTELATRCGYGFVGYIDADTVAYGIIGQSIQSNAAVVVDCLNAAANNTGAGTAGQNAVLTATGGTATPHVIVKSWFHRGTWVGGASTQGAGVLIVPGTNPG